MRAYPLFSSRGWDIGAFFFYPEEGREESTGGGKEESVGKMNQRGGQLTAATARRKMVQSREAQEVQDEEVGYGRGGCGLAEDRGRSVGGRVGGWAGRAERYEVETGVGYSGNGGRSECFPLTTAGRPIPHITPPPTPQRVNTATLPHY